jgi:predicted MFS family arabinose efflux permease
MIHTSVWSQLASLPFMIILAFTHHLKLAFVCFLFRGALMNLGQPVYTNFAMERVPVELQPVANGFLMVAWTGSWMVSARAGGALIERFGFEAPLLITAGLYLVSSFLSLAFFRRAEKPFTGQVGSFYEEAV